MGFSDLDYGTVVDVLSSWEIMRRKPDYALTGGTLLFSHLFEKHPGSKIFFGFPKDMDASCDALRKSQRFARHASFMIEMLDKSLNLLGPDAELLADIMAELGQKHVAMGITDPSYYTAMGESLLLMMQEQIGEEFTPEVEHSWTEVYGELAGAMTREIGNSATK